MRVVCLKKLLSQHSAFRVSLIRISSHADKESVEITSLLSSRSRAHQRRISRDELFSWTISRLLVDGNFPRQGKWLPWEYVWVEGRWESVTACQKNDCYCSHAKKFGYYRPATRLVTCHKTCDQRGVCLYFERFLFWFWRRHAIVKNANSDQL